MRINEILECLNCGFCLKVCPQYAESKKETVSPRGKILNLKYCFENHKNVDFIDDFESCGSCLKCQQICPANIDFEKCFNKNNIMEALNETNS